jgi:transposase
MSKYNLAFKLAVIAAYDAGGLSFREVGARFGLGHSPVRQWIALFRLHGVAGLETRHQHYSAVFKLFVLQRIWDDGLSHRQAGVQFNVRNISSIALWQRRYDEGGAVALEPRSNTRSRTGRPRSMPLSPKNMPAPAPSGTLPADDSRSREELLKELHQLRMENDYLKKLRALRLEAARLAK